jgi:D-alanyl-D-alanine carboxypeptidase/D-alanyl-D-alanine-endopeptidase (penicillin-binding protein 4)
LSVAIADARLATALDSVLLDPDLGGGRSDSCLVVQRGGDTLYDQRGDRALTPASTLKLLTGAVALQRLGADTQFKTLAVAKAAVSNGNVSGDLVLVGGGDPLLATADYEASYKDQPRLFSDLTRLADDTVNAGVKSIDGAVVGDERRYDTQRAVPTWKAAYTADGDVGPLSALALNDGLLEWKPKAIPAPAPAGHAAAVFADLLKARGVTIAGDPRDGAAPANPRTIASLPSLPVRQIVGEMLVHSDNETAELLTKELGRRFGSGGTTAAGVAVVRKSLADAGLDVSALATTDGSGLDPTARVPCAVLERLLTGPTKDPIRAAGLAVAGQTGTMFDRFKTSPAAGRLKAKTGTLEGVVGLAGFVDPPAAGPSGTPLTFAFLANSLPRPSDARGKRIQERLGAALAAYPDAPPQGSLLP